jgi:hypothetical protein
MNYRHFLFCLFFCFVLYWNVIAGESARFADSIESLIHHAPDKKARIRILLDATKQLSSTDPGNALLFASRALSQAGISDYPELKLQAMIERSKIEILKTRFTEEIAMVLKAREQHDTLQIANVVNGRFDQLIDLRPATNGVYMVVIRNSSNQVVKKVIINK